MKSISALALVLVLAAGLTGVQHSTALTQTPETTRGSWACDMVLSSGKTAQESLDAIMLETAQDQRLFPEQRISVLNGKAEFDGLCAVDVRFGTREASLFADQEAARWKRLGDATTAAAKH